MTEQARWIGGRGYDLFFFFGSAGLGALAGALALAAPSIVMPLFWAFLLLVDGPHLAATFTRTYLDPKERRERQRLLLFSLAWLAPGLAAWAAVRASGSRVPLDLYLLLATLWSFHHSVRQNYGIMAIYEQYAHAPPLDRVRDRFFLHGSLWLAFGLFLLVHPVNRSVLGLPADPPRWLSTLTTLGTALLIAMTALFVALRLFGPRARGLTGPRDLRPLLFALFPALSLQLFAMFVVGAFEPLVPRPLTPEQAFLTTAVVGGVAHGLQYIGIVAAVNRRRHGGREGAPVHDGAESGPVPRSGGGSLVATLGTRPLAAYGVFVAVSLVYVAINAARGVSPPVTLFPPDGPAAELFLVIYWGIFFHHYYLDQKIWRVRQDPRLRFELGMEAAS